MAFHGSIVVQDHGKIKNAEVNNYTTPKINTPVATNAALPKATLLKFQAFRQFQNETLIHKMNQNLPISILPRLVNIATAVGRITSWDKNNPTVKFFGTGFLIASDYVMTNEHVLGSSWTGFVEFGYDDDNCDKIERKFQSISSKNYIADKFLDFAIIKLQNPFVQNNYIALDNSSDDELQDNRLIIIHHPAGDPKKISLHGNRVVGSDDLCLWYTNDTAGGSSGSPVFNTKLNLVALHRRFVQLDNDETLSNKLDNDEYNQNLANEGVLIKSVLAELKKIRKTSQFEGFNEILPSN